MGPHQRPPSMSTSTSPSRDRLLAALAGYFDDGRFAADLARRIACRTESDGGSVPPAGGMMIPA